MAFNYPWVLWLLPLALLPILLERSHSRTYSWLSMLPPDPLSSLIGLLLKILASIALLAIILGLAGPHSLEQQEERVGVGAQIGLVLDRSASMDAVSYTHLDVYKRQIAHRVVFSPVYEMRRTEIAREMLSGIINAIAAP